VSSRKEVERALTWSNIKSLPRLLVFALATKANDKTGVIADEHTPSLRTLADMTGIAKSVLPGHLAYLSNLGWLKIDAPSRSSKYDRNRYAIMVGADDPARPSRPSNGLLETEDQEASGLPDGPLAAGRETDSSNAGETDSAGRETDSSNSQQAATRTADDLPFENSAGRETDQQQVLKPKTKRTTTRKPRTPKPASSSSSSNEPEGPNAGRLLKGWIDYCAKGKIQLPKPLIGRYAAVIKAALDEFDAAQVEKALVAMYAQKAINTPSQLSAFLVQIQTGPREWPNRGQPAAYQNPASQDDYDDWTHSAPPNR